MKSLIVLLFCAASARPLFAQEQWISLTTAHFEMYTTNAQGPASQELQFLDEIRSFFANTAPFSNKAEDLSVQIIAFRSEAGYAPYAFREAGGAYSLRTFNHDYMVLPSLASRERELVAHEFTHLVVQHAGFKLPVWLNEGLAEFYSTVNITAEKTTVGRPLSRHIQTIHRQQWIPWDVLFAVDSNSPYYTEGKNVSLFYAQSWALVHMLALSEDYSKGFQQFLSAVSTGQTTSGALQSTYKRDMASIGGDLATYIHRKALPEVSSRTQSGSRIQPVLGVPSDFQLNFTLANLLSGKASTLAQAQAKLAELSQRYPERPETEEVLGALTIQQNRKDEARSHLALAVQRHSRNAEIICQYAALQQDGGAHDAEVAATLRLALEVQPDFEKARLELGLMEAQDSHFESALSLLANLKAISRDDEYDVDLSIAQCHFRLDHGVEATTYAKKAKQAARNPQEKKEADDLLANIESDRDAEVAANVDDSPTKPPPALSSVWGRTKALDCSTGQKHLRVEVAGHNRDMVFAINEPNLSVRNASESYSHWQCGPLKAANVTVVFTPRDDANASSAFSTDGDVRELVFADVVGAINPRKRK